MLSAWSCNPLKATPELKTCNPPRWRKERMLCWHHHHMLGPLKPLFCRLYHSQWQFPLAIVKITDIFQKLLQKISLILNRLTEIHGFLLTQIPRLCIVSTWNLHTTANLNICTSADSRDIMPARNTLVYEHYSTLTIKEAVINILPKNKAIQKCHFRCHSWCHWSVTWS